MLFALLTYLLACSLSVSSASALLLQAVRPQLMKNHVAGENLIGWWAVFVVLPGAVAFGCGIALAVLLSF